MAEVFLFTRGPTGRGIIIDAQGRLVATGDSGASGFPYAFGDTGRVMVVDSSGRLILSPLSEGLSDNTSVVNLGMGSGIFVNEVGDEIRLRSLIPGSNVTFSVDGNSITINGASSSSGTGSVDNGLNVGSGAEIFLDKSGTDLRFRTLLGGSGIQIVQGLAEVTINNSLVDDFNDLQSDFSNSSGNFYRKDENLIPDTNNAFSIGNASTRFTTLFAASGNFSNGVQVGVGSCHINPNGIISGPTVRLRSGGVDNLTASGNRIGISKVAPGAKLDIVNALAINGINLAQNAAGNGISVTIGNVVGHGIIIDRSAGASDGMLIQMGATTTGNGIQITAGGTSLGIRIVKSGTANNCATFAQQTNTTCLFINKTSTGTGEGILVSNSGTGPGIQVNQGGAARGIFISKTNVGAGAALEVDNDGTGIGVSIIQDGAAIALNVDQDGAATAAVIDQSANQIALQILKTGSGAGVACEIDNDGTGIGLSVIQDGAAIAVNIDQDGAADAVNILTSVDHNGLVVTNDNAAATQALIDLSHAGTDHGTPDIEGSSNRWQISAFGAGCFQHVEYEISSHTISGGAITIFGTTEGGILNIDTEAAAASDDLDTITLSGVTVGFPIIILKAANGDRTVNVRHNGGGTGNIRLNGAADFALDDTPDRLMLIWDGSLWCALAPGSNNG